MVTAERPLLDRQRALQHVSCLSVLVELVVRAPEVIQRAGHIRVVGAVRPLEDRERAFLHVSLLGGVA